MIPTSVRLFNIALAAVGGGMMGVAIASNDTPLAIAGAALFLTAQVWIVTWLWTVNS